MVVEDWLPRLVNSSIQIDQKSRVALVTSIEDKNLVIEFIELRGKVRECIFALKGVRW